jgi:hypothetical protein
VIEINQIIKEVSELTGIDRNTVEVICKHPFLFTTNIMKDNNDIHDILFAKLFKFKLKERFKKNKTTQYSPHYEKDYNEGYEEDNKEG